MRLITKYSIYLEVEIPDNELLETAYGDNLDELIEHYTPDAPFRDMEFDFQCVEKDEKTIYEHYALEKRALLEDCPPCMSRKGIFSSCCYALFQWCGNNSEQGRALRRCALLRVLHMRNYIWDCLFFVGVIFPVWVAVVWIIITVLIED